MFAAQSQWPAWLALLVAGGALAWQVATYFVGRDERTRRDEEIRGLRKASTEAIVRLAESSQGGTLARAHAEGAQLSARFSREGRGQRLVVLNKGPGGAQLRHVGLAPGTEGVMLGPTGLDAGAIDLLPDEEHRMVAQLAWQSRPTVDIELRWLDSHGEHERVQSIATS